MILSEGDGPIPTNVDQCRIKQDSQHQRKSGKIRGEIFLLESQGIFCRESGKKIWLSCTKFGPRFLGIFFKHPMVSGKKMSGKMPPKCQGNSEFKWSLMLATLN